MADELTATGLSIDTLEDRIAAVSALLRSAISPNLDLSPDQPSGQIVRILCERTQSVLELVRSVHSGFDPDAASGDALTALGVLTGTQRRAATEGHVTLTCNLDGATTLTGGVSAASVAGDATNRWVLDTTYTSPAGPAGNYFLAFTAENPGAIQAVAGTITVIATPTVGWNTVTNAVDATEGLAEETDTALRLRRELELAIGGSTSVDAIQAELSQLVGMIEATVLENDSDVTVDGIPPHAFEAIVWDGAAPAVADADIAETIFRSKAAGIRAWGSTLVTPAYVDDQGNSHAIRFTRADDLRIKVEVTLTHDASYIGNALVKAAIVAAAAAFFTVGDDVFRSRITDWVMGCGGVENVSLVRLAIFPAGVAAADIAVAIREIATIAVADIVVIS